MDDHGLDESSESEGERPSIEGALAVAFRAAAPQRPASVLDALGAGGSRVLLRDPPSEPPSPVVAPRAAGVEGRYQVLGEIARGGIGVVLKGRDADLGRDVAMKVLREEHARDPRLVQRFVEEAQIAGQLQHPGIVPVYELGLRADKRPYFTMKLVKGRTLAALLADRKTPSDDRHRFLGVFQQICQTVAYAHARGVVHRDLKPSNVMVGAFGEVQVVDWGLAKVLGQGGAADERRSRAAAADQTAIETVRTGSSGAETVAGSVMGTPAYMSPEQASGDVDVVDERTDVFALGAILCEILTGGPPYEGDGIDVARLAARGDVGAARERLAQCGADAEIAALAERCLTRERAERPRDAGVVAADVASYFASVEDRARAAQVASVEARARAAEERAKAERERAAADLARADAEHQRQRAAEERRRRRLTAALAAAVLVTFALTGGAWLWIEHDRAERAAETSKTIEADLAQAALLRGRVLERADVEAAQKAVETARHANDLAAAGSLDKEMRRKTAQALVDSEAGAAKARDVQAILMRGHDLAEQDLTAASAAAREAIALAPECADAHVLLANLLGRAGDTAGMVAEWEEVVRLTPDGSLDASEWRTTLIVNLLDGEWDVDRAVAQARVLVEKQHADQHSHVWTGFALLKAGDFEGAAAEARAAGALIAQVRFWEMRSRWLTATAEAYAKHAAQVPEALQADAPPDPQLVQACHAKRWYAAETRLWTKYIGADPPDAAERVVTQDFLMPGGQKGFLLAFWAARAEVLAGLGEGADAAGVDEAERGRLRASAMERLRVLVALNAQLLQSEPAGKRLGRVRFTLDHWRACGAFRGVREPERLAKLPPDEQQEWRRLWADLDAALAPKPLAAPAPR